MYVRIIFAELFLATEIVIFLFAIVDAADGNICYRKCQ
jgi:hypothetical protein